MPKPKTKADLISQSQESYKTLLKLINSYSASDLTKEFPAGTLNRNIRDVLAHLHQWHLFFCEWYKVGMKGEKPDMPAKGYTWQTIPALNLEVRDRYKDESLVKVKNKLSKSFNAIQKIIKQHTEEELFEKKKYAWTGSTSMGAYLIMNTISHYAWAQKLIKKSLK